MDFAGSTLKEERFNVTVPAGGSTLVKKYRVDELVDDKRTGFMLAQVNAEGDTNHTSHFFTEYKRCELSTAQITSQVEAGDDGGIAVTLTTDKPAFFVTANVSGIAGEFDDNFFTLVPGQARTITFRPKEPVTPEEVERALQIKHLRATYR